MISFTDKEQAELLLKILKASYLSTTPSVKDMIEQAEDEIAYFVRKEIPPLTDEETALIKSKLLNAVVNGKPWDLSDGHPEDWFNINDKGQCCWNWRNSTYPAILIAKELGLMDQVNNTRGSPLHKITEAVKRHASVKPIKQRATKRNT